MREFSESIAPRLARPQFLATTSLVTLLVATTAPTSALAQCLSTYNNVTVLGCTNAGTLTELTFTNSTITSNVINTGTIAPGGFSLINSSLFANFRDSGTITGGILIDAQSSVLGGPVGLNINSTPTFGGGIVNAGNLTPAGGQAGIFVDNLSLFTGGIVNSGTIAAGSIAAGQGIAIDIGHSNPVSTFTGGISNSGTISAGTTGISVARVSLFSGSIGNSGTLTSSIGDAIVVSGVGNFTGSIANSGTINANASTGRGVLVTGASSFSGGITNGGAISAGQAGVEVGAFSGPLVSTFLGGIANTGTITSANAEGVLVTGFGPASLMATFGGGIVNTGTVNGNTAGINLQYVSNFSGGIANGGTITLASTAGPITTPGISVRGISTFAGGINNSGTITSLGPVGSGIEVAAVNVSGNGVATFTGGITNSGTINVTQFGIGLGGAAIASFGGGITNTGSITASTGIVFGSNIATFSGAIANSGNITGTGGTAIDVHSAQNAITINQSGGTIIGAILLSSHGDVLNVSGGAIAGNIVGLGATDAINFALGANTFIYGASYSGINQVNVNSGTVILTGANSSTNTTISAGTLQLGNGGATGSIVGNVTDNGIFAINRSDAFTFGAVISGTGAFQQTGSGATTLTASNVYTGPTTVTAGTLTISGTGSITSNVMNNATFDNAGTVTGSVTNNGTASNSGTITNGLANVAGTMTNTGTINGGLSNSAIVNANGGAINGAIANNAGATFNVAGTVTSNSTFANAAGGTLAVGTTGNYTLQGLLTNSGTVTVAGGGQLIDTVGGITNNVGGTITVAAGGTVTDDLNNAGVVGNNGAYVANVASNTGSITNSGVWTGNVTSNAGTITNNLTWTGTVSNAGTFNNNAGATVSGLLTNTAGVATNNGTLAGGAIISGGTLTGAGSVTNLTIANGGTFAPGNGTAGTSMAVTGNLAFQSGALYLLQFNPATTSFTTVAGSATLGGATVSAVFMPGSFMNRQYTILTAAGGVSGTFNPTVISNMANVQSTLSYDANDAFLNVKLVFAPPPNVGFNVNQQNVATTLTNFFNASGSIPVAFVALGPAGLTQASGETATGTQQTTFDAMNQFMGLMTDPFGAGRDNGVSSSSSAPGFSEDGDSASGYAQRDKPRSNSERDAYAAVYRKAPAMAEPFAQRWSVWAAGFGGSQTSDGNAALGSNTVTSRVYGTAVGADYRLSPFTLAGFALAGGGTNFSIANGLGTGRSDLFQAGAFVRHTVGPAYISAALAYGWQDVTTDRTVTAAGVDQLRARFNANAWSGRVEGGYRFVTPWMGVTPYAAGQFTTFDLPVYAEQAIVGANTFALAYGAKSVTASRSELGLRTDKSWAMRDSIFTLRGRLAWAHDFNPDRNIAATFQTLPGASFVVNGAAQAHDAALTTASAEVKWLNGWSAAATFEGEFSDVTRSYAGKGVVRYAW